MHEERTQVTAWVSLSCFNCGTSRPHFSRQCLSHLLITKTPTTMFVLQQELKADLAWWKCFLQRWNGSSILPLLSPFHHVYSDVSGIYCCGAVVGSVEYIQIEWPSGWEGVDIPVKVLVPVLPSGEGCGRGITFSYTKIINLAAVSILNTKFHPKHHCLCTY